MTIDAETVMDRIDADELVKYAVRHEAGDESEETAGHALGLGGE